MSQIELRYLKVTTWQNELPWEIVTRLWNESFNPIVTSYKNEIR